MGCAAALRARRRRAQPAHARRLLHHGHAGLRADGLLRVPRHQARRRQRRHLPVRQAGARDRRRDAVRPRPARRRSTTACSPRWSRPTRFSRCCSRSRFGHALAGIRVNEQRMRAAGFSTYALQARRLRRSPARSPASPASCSRCKDGVVNPELLSWHQSGAVLLMLILGGIGSLRGAVLGAFAFALLKELFQSEALVGPLADALAADARAGDHRLRRAAAARADRPAGAAASRRRRRRGADDAAAHADRCCAAARASTRRFGGLAAVDAVSHRRCTSARCTR